VELICRRQGGVYRLVLTAVVEPGDMHVRQGLFPDYDLEDARSATHMIIDAVAGEVAYLGSEAHTRAALSRMLEQGRGFTMAPVINLNA
jgi:hypothetical protein